MLPEFLTSQYQQYKRDTDAIASWLAKTAKRCGYASDLLYENDEPAQKTQRLKGKARKQAKEAAAKPQSPSQAAPTPKGPIHTILVKDFNSLADCIAAYAKPPVVVPRSISDTLNRAIAARKEHGAFLSATERTPKEQQSDERHSYFVGVLEHVRDVLRPRMPVLKASDDADAGAESVTNAFTGLSVEEPSESFLEAPNATISKRPEPDYRAEQLQDEQEAYYALYLLLQDLIGLRNVVSRTWEGYRIGQFDLISASVTTNTAIDLARNLEDEAKKTFEKNGGVSLMLGRYYMGQCLQRGEDANFREQPGDELNFRTYDAAEAIMFPTYELLNAFKKMVSPTNIPMYQAGLHGEYNPRSERATKDSRQKFLEDKLLLWEMLTEFAILCSPMCSNNDTVPAEDELIRGLRLVFFKSQDLNLWTVFATQTFLDIHHVLRENIVRGRYELHTIATVVKSSLKQNLAFHASLKVDNWPRSNDMALMQILARIEDWVEKDPIQEVKLRKGDLPSEPQRLLANHPLYCGLLGYNLKALFQDAGIKFANAWGSIMYTQHLYNAVKQEKLLNSKWMDMEMVEMLQGSTAFFAGAPPKDPQSYMRRFLLNMGASASNFAKNKRSRRVEESKSGPRGLEQNTPVATMFMDRFCYESDRVELRKEDLAKILEKGAWEEEIEDSSGHYILTRSMAPKKPTPGSRPSLTMTELLASLRAALQGEMLEVSFDYFMLHRFCWKLLRSIKESCDGRLKDMYGPGYLEEENKLPFVVGYIFMAAVNAKEFGAMLLPKSKRKDVVTSKLLIEAANAMDEMMQTGAGQIVSTVLKNQYNIGFEMDSDDEA